MGTLQTPDGGYINPEWQELGRKIALGDGLQWRGDPSLWLGLGVLRDPRTGRQGHRLEVWRHTELGEDVMIGHWHPSEQFRICMDLAEMDPRSPGHVALADKLEAHDAKMEKAALDARTEAMTEAMEHAVRAHVKLNEPGNKFTGIPGLRKEMGSPAQPSLDGVR